MKDIILLLTEKKELERRLNELIYGSIEIRENKNKRHIYLHFREEGLLTTRYVGEYSDEMYNLILNNNIKAKSIKKDIKSISKQLKERGYVQNEISEKVALNIDFAKKHLVDTIYKQAILEGIATTYADTETIVEGGKVNNLTSDEVLKVLNLKHAWEFILNQGVITSPTNFALLCEINKFVLEGFYYNAGRIRTTPVSIGGTTWKPDFPVESIIKEDLEEILNCQESEIDKAIELLLFVMKRQIFIDGNKRTAVIFANHFLIANAKGLIVIPSGKVEEYKKLLIDYYEGRDINTIKKFLKEECFAEI